MSAVNSNVKSTLKSNRPTPRKDFNELLEKVKNIYSSEDLKVIEEVYISLKSSGKQKSSLLREIVPIEEWLDSEYYLGSFKYDLYEYWRDVIVEIVNRKGNSRVNQVIFTGAIGTGKSTAAIVLMVRKIYELSCHKNISALFKLGNISRIAFAYLSVTREQAQNTGFAALQEMVDQIPYFSEVFPRKGNLDSVLVWPQEKLFVMHGSIANHFIGMNLIGSILDEANFHSGRASEEAGIEANSKVARLYSQTINRAESRFIIDGINESISMLISSSTNVSSFTEQMINKHARDPHTYITSPSLWDVKPWNYKSGRFMVYTGGDGFEPFILDSLDDINILLAAHGKNQVYGMSLEDAYKLLSDGTKQKIIAVPSEHRISFSNDIVMALQDIAGFSSVATRKFFSNYIAYNKCINDDLVHPFSKSEFKISTTKLSSQDGFLPISAYLLNGIDFANKQMLRYMHVDLATTGDSIGMTMCHTSKWKTIHKQIDESINEEKKDKYALGINDDYSYDKYHLGGLFNSYKNKEDENIIVEHKAPVIALDFMIKFNPPAKPERMPISKIRDFILYLSQIGIRFGKITFDQWGSEQIRQELTDLGYNVGLLSVDRTTEPYYTLANLIYEERLEYYDYVIFKEELFNLVEDRVRKKIDHTPDFHKDVADSAAGAVFNATKAEDKTDLQEEGLANIYINANKNKNDMEDEIQRLTKELIRDANGRTITTDKDVKKHQW